jgi:23S rRNA-/tRNA-specific pseudouridylate synthase
VWRSRPGSAKRRSGRRETGPLRIVYEDEALAVIDKPPGLLSVPLAGDPSDSVASLLPLCWKGPRFAAAFVVHRLDRDTSGLVVFAKSTASCQTLKTQFITRAAVREYLTIVHGVPEARDGEWRDIMRWNPSPRKSDVIDRLEPGALEARLRYRVVEALDDAAVLDVSLITGRRNQIRVQAAWRGFPVFGERQYARTHDPSDGRRCTPCGCRLPTRSTGAPFNSNRPGPMTCGRSTSLRRDAQRSRAGTRRPARRHPRHDRSFATLPRQRRITRDSADGQERRCLCLCAARSRARRGVQACAVTVCVWACAVPTCLVSGCGVAGQQPEAPPPPGRVTQVTRAVVCQPPWVKPSGSTSCVPGRGRRGDGEWRLSMTAPPRQGALDVALPGAAPSSPPQRHACSTPAAGIAVPRDVSGRRDADVAVDPPRRQAASGCRPAGSGCRRAGLTRREARIIRG